MGRYNNKRTQAAAQAAKNTPSRARFSKGPPNQSASCSRKPPRKEEPPPKTKTRGIGGGATPSSNNNRSRRGRGNPQTTARVIDKIQNRVGNSNATTTTTASASATAALGAVSPSTGNSKPTEVALNNLDVSKLDVVAVSNETQNLISDLLRELGVVGGTGTGTGTIAHRKESSSSSNNKNSKQDKNTNKNTNAKPQGMNPNATEFEFNPSPAIVPEEDDAEEDDESENDHDHDSDDSADDDDNDDYGFVGDSQARNVGPSANVEGLYEYGEGGDDHHDDPETAAELQRVLVAARRRREERNREANPSPTADGNDLENDDNYDYEDGDELDDRDSDSDGDDEDAEGGWDSEPDRNTKKDNGEIDAAALASDPTFCHLTQILSFSYSQAAQACRAIECWETNLQSGEESTNNNNNNNNNNNGNNNKPETDQDEDDRRLELAMDWLCLHLAQNHLEAGFRQNANAKANANKGAALGKRSSSTSTKIRAVSHPSISVISKPIAEQAKEWAAAVALQERTLRFQRLGFHRSDIVAVLDRCGSAGNTGNVTDDPALPVLLAQLQDADNAEADVTRNVKVNAEAEAEAEANDASKSQTNASLRQHGRDERDQELEALRAIYDDRLTVVYADGSRSTGSSMEDDDENDENDERVPERYVIGLDPVAPLGATEESFLHVLLRDSYPAKRPPLLMLTTVPSLPPSLVRTIHCNLGRRAGEVLGLDDEDDDDDDDDIVGCPVVFDLVSYLEEELPELHAAFLREQRRKEFKAEQARMLRQQQQEDTSLDMIDYDLQEMIAQGGGGRRQKAKLRAAQKAYDRPDQQQRLLEQYQRRQDARIKIAQTRNKASTVRASHATQAILKRQNQIVEEEAELAARRAMNEAFRNGASTEEARAAAQAARIEAYKTHGVEWSGDDGDSEEQEEEKKRDSEEGTPESSESNHEEPEENSATGQAPLPTKASSEFMERLRKSAPKSASSDSITSEQDSVGPSQQQETSASRTGRPTPNTSAFMDRLREMYERAASAKQGKNANDDEEKEANDTKSIKDNKMKNRSSGSTRLEGYHLDESIPSADEPEINLPRPVAVPSGELAVVMQDVIKQQEHQPWLVSSEARAPTTTSERVTVSTNQKKRERDISDRLRKELARKRKLASEWAESHPKEEEGASSIAKPKSNKRGKQDETFTPQRFHEMLTARQRLPAFQLSEELVQTIDRNQITVIAGATGCGKTTQVPQLVLDDLIGRGLGAATNMIVTQPRRISAIGVSERIAQERCEKVGETCGYSIKLEKKMSARTRLLLCTTGVLLRRLQCDPDLASVSHIFVDEVHERDLNTDFLIIILKDLLARRKNLKLVLMSATLNADSFSNYFGGCPVVSIPGRAHPVQEHRLEDILELTGYQVEEGSDYALKTGPNKPAKISKSTLRRLYHPKYSKETIHSMSIVNENVINYELLSELLEHISLHQGEGAILVFCPGFQEIQKTIEEMYKKEYFQGPNVVIYPLHSSLSTDEQVAIFDVPPPGVRKIVVSTNIAETSITIEDVVFVVDTGKVKENRRDEVNETPTLEECWVSRASAKQRRGRAGRVRPGIAYHMYSSHTHDDDLLEYQLPEMLRVGIEDLVLQILILDLGEPTSFLKKALDPPSNLALSNSLRLLEELGAVDCQWKNRKSSLAFSSVKDKEKEEEDLEVSSELTALGFHLATLPVDPRVGKMMIYGALFGCVDPLLTFAAAMSARSPFVSPFDRRDQADEARKTFSVAGSDHLTILNAFNQWSELRRSKGNRVVNEFLKDNFLGRLTLFQMEDLRRQFHSLLIDIGFLPKKFRLKDMDHVCNDNSENQGLIKAILCAGLYPNIIVAPRTAVARPGVAPKKSDKKMGEHAFRSHTKGEVYLHPSTIAFDESNLDSRYCCYHELIRTSKTYVRDCTTVSPFALLLFGGTLEVFQTHGICSVDGWLKFRIDAKPATLIKYLRGKMERLLFQKIVSPQEDVIESEEGRALIQSISRLFEAEEHQRKHEAAGMPDRSGGEIVRPWSGVEGENERIRAIQEEINRRNRDGASRRPRHHQGSSDTSRDSSGSGRGEGRGGRGRGGRRGGRSGRGRGSRR